MKKTIFLCVGNAILFSLFGLALAYPVSEVVPIEGTGFGGELSVFPLLLVIWLAAYPVTYALLKKKFGWKKKDASELEFSDEREKMIVSEAAKVSYTVLIGGVLVIMAVLAVVKFFSLFAHATVGMYSLCVSMLAILLVAATLAYCVKWCVEYRR